MRLIALPEGEQHLTQDMARAYQADKRQAALAHCKDFRSAVDVGAHCGLWSMHLVGRFQAVHAFEPLEVHRECFRANVPEKHAYLYACALGSQHGRVRFTSRPGCSAHSVIAGEGEIPLHPLDDFDFQDVDLLKLDCVGYELEVLIGARKTLARCRPVVSVEQKPGYAEALGLPVRGAVDYLLGMGAKVRAEQSGVFVLSWD